MYRPLAVFLLSLALPSVAVAGEPEPKVVAFIGRLVSIKELPDQCPKTETPKTPPQELDSICVQFDSLYEARYEVVETLSGSIQSKQISFNVADHYGFPRFAEYQSALLFVDVGPDENWLEKYQGYPVHRTLNSSWASCGNPYDERKDDTPRHLQSVSFARDFGIVGEFSHDGVTNRFFDSKYMVVEDGRITCHKGIYARDLYELVRTGVMAARGIKLPALGVNGNDL